MFDHYAPHGDKLTSLLGNSKLPEADRPRLESTINRYKDWIEQIRAVEGTSHDSIAIMVAMLNEYKNHIDLELILIAIKIFYTGKKVSLNSITRS